MKHSTNFGIALEAMQSSLSVLLDSIFSRFNVVKNHENINLSHHNVEVNYCNSGIHNNNEPLHTY